MARIRGDDGVVLVGANPVASVREWSLDIEGEEYPVPAMGDSAQVNLAGIPKVSGILRCWLEDSDPTGQEALTQGATVALELRPEGTGSGLLEYSLTSARIIAERFRGAFGGGAEKEISFVSDALPDRTDQV